MQPTPHAIHMILVKEILSAIPNSPIAVVTIRTSGPINARELLTTNAFSTSLNFKINMAAKISKLPDNKRKNAMPIIAFSNKMNILHSSNTSNTFIVCAKFWRKDNHTEIFKISAGKTIKRRELSLLLFKRNL